MAKSVTYSSESVALPVRLINTEVYVLGSGVEGMQLFKLTSSKMILEKKLNEILYSQSHMCSWSCQILRAQRVRFVAVLHSFSLLSYSLLFAGSMAKLSIVITPSDFDLNNLVMSVNKSS